MKILHIIATPRAHESNTLRVSNAFIERLHEKYLDLHVEELNVFQNEMPSVAGDNIETKYTLMRGMPIDKRHQESWKQIETMITHFMSADAYLISTPMWNLSIPYALKFYIDAIVQPGYLFRYNEIGQAIGMVTGRKMVIIGSRGGDYSPSSHLGAYDFQESYLRAIFGFVGITDLQFVPVQPMDINLELRQAAVHAAIQQVQQIADTCNWGVDRNAAPVENPETLKPRPIVA